MNDLLRRQQAPIAPAAWLAIEAQARELLAANLSARKLIDVSGPHGWHHAAVDLGRLDPGAETAADGVMYGIRKVLPLVEIRVAFSLDLWQLDDVVRGARDPDLEPLIAAAGQLVAFEERAVYHGFDPAGDRRHGPGVSSRAVRARARVSDLACGHRARCRRPAARRQASALRPGHGPRGVRGDRT